MDNVVGNGRGLESSLPFGSELGGDKALAASDFFRKVLDALPVAIYATDARGRITYFNEAAAALWGNRPELGRSEWCGSWRLYWPDGTFLPHSECPMATAVKEKRPIRGMEAVAERPDGSRVPVVPFPTPIYGEADELIGAVNMVLDISDRKRADQHLRRIASIVDSCDDAIISKDLNGTILSWNHGAERLFGYSAEEAVGKLITMLIPPERLDEEPRIVERLRRGERNIMPLRKRLTNTPAIWARSVAWAVSFSTIEASTSALSGLS
jgi:PAS domain S-box-containing protein